MKVYKIQFSFLAKSKKKRNNKKNRIVMKLELFYEIRNMKPCYQSLMLRFNCNDPKQRYYLNGMWTCIDPVSVIPESISF